MSQTVKQETVSVQGKDLPLSRNEDGSRRIAMWRGDVPSVITGERLVWLAYNGQLGSLGTGQGKTPAPLRRYLDDERECSVEDVTAALLCISEMHAGSKHAKPVSKNLRQVRNLLAKRDAKAAEEAAAE